MQRFGRAPQNLSKWPALDCLAKMDFDLEVMRTAVSFINACGGRADFSSLPPEVKGLKKRRMLLLAQLSPKVFECESSSDGERLWVGVTEGVKKLQQAEESALKNCDERRCVAVLKRLLMLCKSRRARLASLDKLRYACALPPDFGPAFFSRHDHSFALHNSGTAVELVASEVVDDGESCVETMNTDRSSANADTSDEKRALQVYYELLNSTLAKRCTLNLFSCLGDELDLPPLNWGKFLSEHPSMFYVSFRCRRSTGFLKQAYDDTGLRWNTQHPLLRIRDEYSALLSFQQCKQPQRGRKLFYSEDELRIREGDLASRCR